MVKLGSPSQGMLGFDKIKVLTRASSSGFIREAVTMSLATPFNTERLWFRLLSADDLDVVHRQFSDPEMCAYLSEPPITRDQAREIIAFFQNPDRDGYLRWAMFHRETGEFIGTCGYHHWDREKGQVELGYDIWRAHWRRGYASEALVPLLETCFQYLDVGLVYLLIDPRNVASIQTALKFGFRECEPCRPLDEPSQVCMKLSRAEWEDVSSRLSTNRRDGESCNGL